MWENLKKKPRRVENEEKTGKKKRKPHATNP
jgi:hypothetical protein